LRTEVVADLVDGHVLVQASQGKADNGALGYIQAWPAEEARDAGLL